MATTDGRAAGTKDLVPAPATPVRQFAAKGSFARRRRFYFLARTKTTPSLSSCSPVDHRDLVSVCYSLALVAEGHVCRRSRMVFICYDTAAPFHRGISRRPPSKRDAAGGGATVARVVGQVFPVVGGREGGREGVVFLSPFRISLPPSPPPLQTPKGRTSGRNNGRHYFCVRRPTDPRPPPFFPPRLPPLARSAFSPGHKFVEFESAPRELFLRDSTRNRMDGMGSGEEGCGRRGRGRGSCARGNGLWHRRRSEAIR